MADTLQKFRVYPRGFLGVDVAQHFDRTPKPYAQQLGYQQYTATGGQQDGNDIPINPHVESLYSDYIRNVVNTSNFEFRRRALLVAFQAFGTPRFDIWMLAQYKNPAAGQLHGKFLEDTIHFLQTGRRDMALETWASLITITDEGNRVGKAPESIIKYFDLDSPSNLRSTDNSMLVNTIQSWCSKEGGLEDLIGTLHILFGKY